MSISIIIPNYNGERLIQQNLSHVIKSLLFYIKENKSNGEIIVVDDCSSDNSVTAVNKYIKEAVDYKLKLLINSENTGYSFSVNRGVSEAIGDIVVLLNTDVIPREDFLIPLVKRFQDKSVFAVGCLEKSKEKEKIVLRGRGIGQWKRGFLVHKRGEVDKDNTLWVSGGSSAIKKEIWEKLGGLFSLYNPFYWEDIDISYRALKSGYKIYFDKKSIVEHMHDIGAIKSHFSPFEIKATAYRNQIIFTWINMTDVKLVISHLLWLPIHLFSSLIHRDWAFIIGFFRSFVLLGKVIEKRKITQKMAVLKDYEVIKQYEI